MINQISYGKQSIDKDDIKTVLDALKSKNLTQGPLVEKFETALKKKFKSRFSTVVSNGSASLFLIGKILKWKKGDLIATSPITFISSVNTIEHSGAKPLFIDINLSDYCMDPVKLEEALIKDKLKKIKAVIVTDFGGQPAKWKKFFELKKKYKINLINDNCHSMGSAINNDIGYASKYADMVSLSFHPVKAITTGEGGAILTNNKKFDLKAKLLRSHGIERNDKTFWSYEVNSLGYNFRLPDINCALGISQLKKLNKFVNKRKKIANIYNNSFKNISVLKIPNNIKYNQNSYHLYPLLIKLKKLKKNKKKIIKEFLKNNIKLQVHYIPVNSQPYYKKKYGLVKKKFKNSFLFFNEVISLPIFYDLDNNKIKYILKVCKKVFKI